VEFLARQRTRLDELRAGEVPQRLLAPPTVSELSSAFPIHGFPDGAVFDLAFPSQFPPPETIVDETYSSVTENQTSYVRLWEHSDPGKSRLTLVAIHGWTMGDQRVNSIAFLPGVFFSAGFDVALVELPFHGRRAASRGAPVHFPSPDPVRTLVGVAHAVHDLRYLRTLLEARGHTRFGCMGMSLGSYIGQLWCSLDRLEKVVSLVPLVSMGDMVWELLRARRAEGVRALSSKGLLRELFRDHCALEFPCATDQEQILVLCGRGDQLLPRTQVALLRDHWPHARFEWKAGGHGAHVRTENTFRRIVDFLAS
jgi:pimeloyl-ACP methyl ester carboxylesterase